MRPKLTNEEYQAAIKMFFWTSEAPPDRFINQAKTAEQLLALAGALGMGEVLDAYRGIAHCRIPNCGKGLGSCDMFYRHELSGKVFIFPERCQHYVLHHRVWVPEANDFIQTVLGAL